MRGDRRMEDSIQHTKKDKIILIVSSLFVVVLLVVSTVVIRVQKEKSGEIFKIQVGSDELIVKEKEGYNSIEIYEQRGRLIVNAKSQAAFFDGAQFEVPIDTDIALNNIKITWLTVDGNTVQTDGNDFVIAHIEISDGNELIFDTKVNFVKDATAAVGGVLNKMSK